jgi:hypothetical protein
MTRKRTVFPLCLLVWLALAVTVEVAYAGKKVTVCHRPPGDPGSAHTISVGEEALPAHLKHGDQVGECPSGCQVNTSICDDANACTADTCRTDGQCEHTAVNCDDGNACTLDSCNSSLGCLNVPAAGGTPCDDGKVCTSDDVCVNTECLGSPVAGCCTINDDCNDNNPCTVDTCSGNACAYQPRDCSVTSKCLVGFCDPVTGGCGTTPVNCDDSNVCTDDHCEPAVGCFSTPTQNPPEPREVSCTDGADNDCDGLIDAADPDCNGITYTTTFLEDTAPTEQQCADWNAFLASLSAGTAFSSITLSGSEDPTGVTCSGPAADEIAQALRSGTPLSRDCNGRTWFVGAGTDCNANGEFAVELALDSACDCAEFAYSVRPCIGNVNWGGVNTPNCPGPTQTITVRVR